MVAQHCGKKFSLRAVQKLSFPLQSLQGGYQMQPHLLLSSPAAQHEFEIHSHFRLLSKIGQQEVEMVVEMFMKTGDLEFDAVQKLGLALESLQGCNQMQPHLLLTSLPHILTLVKPSLSC